MSTVFRTLFDASTVRWGRMRGEWVRGLAESHELVTRVHVEVTSRSIAFLQRNSPVGTLFMIKTAERLILYIVWHVSTNRNMTFHLNFCLDLPARREFRLCTERMNQKELFGHKWTLWNKSNNYCGTGIPGSAFLWRSSKVSEYL